MDVLVIPSLVIKRSSNLVKTVAKTENKHILEMVQFHVKAFI